MENRFLAFLNKIFSRFTFTVIVIVAQLVYFFLLLFRVVDNMQWVSVFFAIAGVICILYVIWRDHNPAYKIGWVLLMSLMPIMGVSLYLFFGNKRPARSLKKRLEPVEEAHKDDLVQEMELTDSVGKNRRAGTSSYIANYGAYPAWIDSPVDYYESGEAFFEKLIDDLEGAERFVFIEFFIVAEGVLLDRLLEVLSRKAREGVEIRIIYDDIGSAGRLSKKTLKQMKAWGIRTMPFNPLKPFLSLVYNNRDHRKIIVIDGYIGYTGGVNIADEYVNELPRFGHWRDNGIRIEGRAVWNFTVMFLNMWNAFKPTDKEYSLFRAYESKLKHLPNSGVVQPFSDTPLDEENLSENIYIDIINQAEDYVMITTPYLIIGNEMQTALTLAAKRGVDVKIVTPGIPDKPLVYALTRSYYEPLIRNGVKIYEYDPGFMHGKVIVSDDRAAVVGTINLDFRSLYLHFECGVLMIDEGVIPDIRIDVLRTISKGHMIGSEDYRKYFAGKLFGVVLRVLSPVL